MQFISLALKGIALGAANIMPGVSGATLAVIFRIYDRIIESINSLFTDMKKSLLFIIPVGLGMVIGILALGSLIDFFIQRFSLQSSGFIAGLMAGSMPFIHSKAVSGNADINNKNDKSSSRLHYYAITVIAAVVIILLAFVAPTPEPYVGTDLNIGFMVLLFVSGLLAAAALIIPGVSGAMVFILFGVYPIVMNTISLIREYLLTPFNFELLIPIIAVAAPIGIGILIGILLMSRVIAILLEKFHNATYFAILGLIFGTIFAIFSDDSTYQSYSEITFPVIIFAVIAFIVGLVMALFLGKQEEEK